MYERYKELTIEGVTRGKDLHKAYILILKEKYGSRLFPVLISSNGYKTIVAALHHKDFTCSRLMNQLAQRVGMTLIGVRILVPHNGQTQALIDFELLNEVLSITVSAAEAAVAAIETKCSLWIEKNRFEINSNVNQREGQMALSLFAMDNDLLKEAIDSAVAEDNYELASILRDELNKRNRSFITTNSTEI